MGWFLARRKPKAIVARGCKVGDVVEFKKRNAWGQVLFEGRGRIESISRIIPYDMSEHDRYFVRILERWNNKVRELSFPGRLVGMGESEITSICKGGQQ